MKIGLIRLSALGDCVLASAVVGALRERYPAAHLSWIATPKGQIIPQVISEQGTSPQGVSQLNSVMSWSSKPSRRGTLLRMLAVPKIRAARFDAMLELHENNISTALILKACGAKQIIGGTSASPASQKYCTALADEQNREHALAFYWRRAALLDVAADAPERFYPTVPIANQTRAAAAQFLKSNNVTSQHRLVLFNLGGTHEEKRWPRARFAELACSLIESDERIRILVSGGPVDAPLLTEFSTELDRVLNQRSQTSARDRVVVASGQLGLLELAAIAEGCALFISGDTGPMHIAAAVGAPLLALFGPTDTRRTAPVYKPGNASIYVIDARETTRTWPSPMTAIEVSGVLLHAQNILNGSAKPYGCFMPHAFETART